MNNLKSFILVLESLYVYTFEYGNGRKSTLNKILKAHWERITQAVAKSRETPHIPVLVK